MKYWIATAVLMVAASVHAGYVDEVTADAPEAMYRFNESVGATTLTDSTGNGHDSLSVSNVTFGATGPVDSAAVFSNGLVELALQFDPSAGDFSVETLIRFDEAGNVLQQLDGTGTGRAILYRLSDGTIASYLGGESTESSTLVSTGEWHHVVMTVEEAGTNDVIRFYIDGESAGSGTADVEAADGNWRIGKGNLAGTIDELAVYTNLLSAEQVAWHYTVMSTGTTSPVHYVSLAGTAVWPYTNWVTAATNIQDAVDTAAVGDTVLVTNGIYMLETQVSVERAITVRSVNGPDMTTIDGQETCRCFNLSNVACTVSGFHIQNGSTTNRGGGVYCYGINPLITNCVLSGNSADIGGGSYFGTLTHCTLTENSAVWYGGGSYFGRLTHCVLSGNESSDTGGGSYKGTLTHCTLFGNAADGSGGGSYYATLVNSILWNNTAGGKGDNDYGSSLTCSCWPGGSSGTGNISGDPLLVNGRLACGSPCIDAGISVSGVTTDLNGTPMPLDGDGDGTALPDMGAFEFADTAADTDGDGLSDWDELNRYHSDPVSSDTDGDGRSDGDEVADGTSPTFDESGVIDAVVANPETYGLYTSNSIADLSMGNVMIQTSNGWVTLNLHLEQCTNLVDGVWTNAGDAVEWQLEAPDGKVFYRVRSGE